MIRVTEDYLFYDEDSADPEVPPSTIDTQEIVEDFANPEEEEEPEPFTIGEYEDHQPTISFSKAVTLTRLYPLFHDPPS